MDNMYLIKYSEIGVKGKNRYIFEDMLVKNIKSALRGGETMAVPDCGMPR